MTFDAAHVGAHSFEFTHSPSDPDAPKIDCETAALMRGWMRPLIEQAVEWPSFMKDLEVRGYGLAFHQGRLWLLERATGQRICTMRHLGASMRQLANRLGRPCVRPIPGNPSWGELHAPKRR